MNNSLIKQTSKPVKSIAANTNQSLLLTTNFKNKYLLNKYLAGVGKLRPVDHTQNFVSNYLIY